MNDLILLGTTRIGDKQYTINDSNGTVQKNHLVTDNWYGGMVKEFRKTKDADLMTCINYEINNDADYGCEYKTTDEQSKIVCTKEDECKFKKHKESGILLCLDKRENILNLAYIENHLTLNDKKLLGIITAEKEAINENENLENENENFQNDKNEDQEEDKEKNIDEGVNANATKKRK